MQIVDCRDWSERRGPGTRTSETREQRVESGEMLAWALNYPPPPTLSTSDLYLNLNSKKPNKYLTSLSYYLHLCII